MSELREYEVLVLSDPNIDEARLDIVFDRLSEVCEKNGARITKNDSWGKRKLAYEIKDLREGVYNLLQVEAVPSAVAKIEAFLKIQNSVMRFMTTKKGEN